MRATFLVGLLGCSPQLSWAEFYLHSWEPQGLPTGHSSVQLHSGYYSSTSNFDSTGSTFIPSGFSSYSQFNSDLLMATTLGRRSTFYGRLGWARAELQSQTSPIAGTNFALTEATAGLSLRLIGSDRAIFSKGFSLDLQTQGDFPLYSNQNLIGPSLGDGTLDITSGLIGQLNLSQIGESLFSISGGIGCEYRSDQFSAALPWSIDAKITPLSTGFKSRIQLAGIQSLKNDPRANWVTPSTPAATIAPGAGGGYFSGAINPSLLNLRAEVGYFFSPTLAVDVFASTSAWGQNSPNGKWMGIALTARLGGPDASNETLIERRRPKAKNSEGAEGFVNYGAEAKVVRVHDQLGLVKIDKGSHDGFRVGQTIDIFQTKKNGDVIALIARGTVTQVNSNDSAVRVDTYFKEVWIDEGFLVKRTLD